jgi:hypothetical protein
MEELKQDFGWCLSSGLYKNTTTVNGEPVYDDTTLFGSCILVFKPG